MKIRTLLSIAILTGIFGSLLAEDSTIPAYIKYSSPTLFNYDEIVEISKDPSSSKYRERLEQLWTTPIISNEAYFRGALPLKPYNYDLRSEVLRCTSWNIEKSMKMKDAITTFSSPEDFLDLIDSEIAPEGSTLREEIIRQRKLLQSSDVIILQEMEIGMKRSGYINAAKELAKKLDMNYVYAPQYLEIDPVPLGLEKVYYEGGHQIDREVTEHYSVDPEKYRGLFGGAVLSRYPVKKVILHPLKHQGYDWYEGEKEKTTFLERARRVGAKIAFKNTLTREIKTGGRSFFRVDLHVPSLPEETLSVINIHLEIKCPPEEREKQIQEILDEIKDIKHPVIMAGDFNASHSDMSPTSIPKETVRLVKDPSTWFSFAMRYMTPYSLVVNTLNTTSNYTKNYDNPLAVDVPVVAPNDLKPMFSEIRNFRFEDGTCFDFRGDEIRSVEKNGILSNSNQRDTKGFKTTFQVNRPILFIGRYRLDWFFVKSFWKNSPETMDQYRFAPHFGETLSELNQNLIEPVSDHSPSVITLPFNEPEIFYHYVKQ